LVSFSSMEEQAVEIIEEIRVSDNSSVEDTTSNQELIPHSTPSSSQDSPPITPTVDQKLFELVEGNLSTIF
jgi:hypothetical protein